MSGTLKIIELLAGDDAQAYLDSVALVEPDQTTTKAVDRAYCEEGPTGLSASEEHLADAIYQQMGFAKTSLQQDFWAQGNPPSKGMACIEAFERMLDYIESTPSMGLKSLKRVVDNLVTRRGVINLPEAETRWVPFAEAVERMQDRVR